jgi:putative CocE/NonD family hydrolase
MAAKEIVRDFSTKVRTIELAWIPMKDGRRLAARLFLPVDAERKPVPAILEYIPYRRRDGTRGRDDETHVWFAGNGYACARVDIAGSGDSDGLLLDEYLKLEQDDALEIIAWLASQPWCTGSVGMIGISWGGFNGLQVAARRPPALKAVISLSSTVDRYADDVHFMGGCLLADNMDWGGAFFSYAGRAPDPAMVGPNWKKIWLERLEALQPFPALWLKHQRRDAFWKHGSVCENYDAIQTPVLSVSGWADGYTAAVFRLTENLKAPCKGIVGPWGHLYPHRGVPGPAIGFMQECKRWWDRWLKGVENGIDREPALRLWLQDSVPPRAHYDIRPGRWIALSASPSPSVKRRKWFLRDGALTKKKGAKTWLKIKSPLTTGLAGGEWCAYGLGKVAPEMPLDQRQDDAGSLVFDSEPLGEALALVGQPAVELKLRSDKPQAMIAVRISDVLPDGAATRVSYGLLNLSHRESHEHPKPLVPGESVRVRLALTEAAHLFAKGHRIRLAISTSYWPMAAPAPEMATLDIRADASYLDLPVLSRRRIVAYRGFKGVEKATPMKRTIFDPGAEIRTVERDISRATTIVRNSRNDGASRIDDIGTVIKYSKVKEFHIVDDDPCSAKTIFSASAANSRDDWNAKLDTSIVMTCDRNDFHFDSKVVAYDGDEIIFARDFKHKIKRDNL